MHQEQNGVKQLFFFQRLRPTNKKKNAQSEVSSHDHVEKSLQVCALCTV